MSRASHRNGRGIAKSFDNRLFGQKQNRELSRRGFGTGRGIAKLLLTHKEAVVILGGEHDLTELLPATVEYVRVTLKGYKAAAE